MTAAVEKTKRTTGVEYAVSMQIKGPEREHQPPTNQISGDMMTQDINDDKHKNLEKEVNAIIASRIEFIERHYSTIRDAHHNEYGYPEFDPLRYEISLCIMFGFCQAAITLTNHFMEYLLKHALIVKHGKDKQAKGEEIEDGAITSFRKQYEEGIKLYGDANLATTIDRACTVGLITRKQKGQLHQFREQFRNAYGHSDKRKTFGKSTIPVTGIKLENGKIVLGEQGDPEIADFLPGQGIIQFEMAQNDAAGYFLYIDKLARHILAKLYGHNGS